MSFWVPIASIVTRESSKSKASSTSGRALISLVFSSTLSWASTRRLSLAHALTKWSGALEVPSREVPSRARVLLSRSAEPRRVFPSRAITPASEEEPEPSFPEPSFFESSCSIRRPTAAVHRRNRSSKAVGSNREITRRKVSSDGVPFDKSRNWASHFRFDSPKVSMSVHPSAPEITAQIAINSTLMSG